jgi:hypothetical protein
MTIPQILILLALTVYALYRQSIRHEIDGKARFKLSCIYAVVGVVVGGFYLPTSATSWSVLAGSLALSAVIGLARGRTGRAALQPRDATDDHAVLGAGRIQVGHRRHAIRVRCPRRTRRLRRSADHDCGHGCASGGNHLAARPQSAWRWSRRHVGTDSSVCPARQSERRRCKCHRRAQVSVENGEGEERSESENSGYVHQDHTWGHSRKAAFDRILG